MTTSFWNYICKQPIQSVNWYSSILPKKLPLDTNIDVLIEKNSHGHSAYFIPEKLNYVNSNSVSFEEKTVFGVKAKPLKKDACLCVTQTHLVELESAIDIILSPMLGNNNYIYDKTVSFNRFKK